MEMTVNRNYLVLDKLTAADFKWRQFGGKNGERYVQIELPEEYAKDLRNLGWRVKKRGKSADLGGYMNSDNMDANLEDAHYFMSIKINYDSGVHIPDIWRIVEGYEDIMVLMVPSNQTSSKERDLATLDKDYIKSAKLRISHSKPNAKDGMMTPYLWDAKITVSLSAMEDDFDDEEFEGRTQFVTDGPLPWEK